MSFEVVLERRSQCGSNRNFRLLGSDTGTEHLAESVAENLLPILGQQGFRMKLQAQKVSAAKSMYMTGTGVP